MSYLTDLDIIKNLEDLSTVINNSIRQTTKILDEAKEINEIRTLIDEMKTSRKSLDLTRDEVIEIEKRLEQLKTLPEKLQALGLDKDLLKNIQEAIIIAEKNKEDIHESEKKVIELNAQTHNLSRKIFNDTEDIKKVFIVYEEKTANAKMILNQLQSILLEMGAIEKRLDPLKKLSEELQKLDIDNNLLKNIQEILIIVEKNKEEIYESEKKVIELNEQNDKLSKKIEHGVQELKKIAVEYEKKNIKANMILNQIKTIKAEIGSVTELKLLLNELKVARSELKSSRQELIAITKLEAYLQELPANSNHKQFRKWLWKELGIVGIMIYFLSIIIPNNSKNN